MKGYMLIDIPEHCSACPLVELEYDWLGMLHRAICKRTKERVEVYCGEERPQFCPIKQLPVKENDDESNNCC